VVFAGEVEGALPHLFGPEEHALRVVEQYHKLVQALAPIGARPVEVRLSPRMAWEVALDNGFKLELGRGDFDERVQTFLTAYRVELHNLASNALVVDLRYKRGLALKIAQLPKPEKAQKPKKQQKSTGAQSARAPLT
jgi:cell division protein FtsQ